MTQPYFWVYDIYHTTAQDHTSQHLRQHCRPLSHGLWRNFNDHVALLLLSFFLNMALNFGFRAHSLTRAALSGMWHIVRARMGSRAGAIFGTGWMFVYTQSLLWFGCWGMTAANKRAALTPWILEGFVCGWVGVSVRVTPGIISMSLWFMLGHYYTAAVVRTSLGPNGFSMAVWTTVWNLAIFGIIESNLRESWLWPLQTLCHFVWGISHFHSRNQITKMLLISWQIHKHLELRQLGFGLLYLEPNT